METSGADLLCATLERLGVRHVFGVPGTQNTVLFDALRRSRLRTVLPTQELAASFMANGCYRASGELAAVTTIPGPGFTLALTGLAEARHDSAALLYLVVRPERPPGRGFPLQEIDQEAMARPVVKETVRVEEAARIPEALQAACAAALGGEPGPVYVELAWRALAATLERRPGEVLPVFPEPPGPDGAEVDEALRLLAAARRVVLFAGGGSSGAAAAVRELAERLGSPVLTTGSGRGVVPEDHPLSLRHDASLGAGREVNRLLERSDLILVLGCKLSHNGTGGFGLELPEDKLLRVDASERVLAADYPARLAIRSDTGRFLARLLARRAPGEPGWRKGEIEAFRKRIAAERLAGLRHPPLLSGGDWAGLFGALREALPAESHLVTDSGLHQVLARLHYRVLAPRGLIAPSDFQSMGFGLPAALGAALASPDRPTVLVLGDGGLLMSGLELLTAVRERIDLTVLLFTDGHYGLIRRQQIETFGEPFKTELASLDLPRFAASLGARYVRLEVPFAQTVARCLGTPGVKILEVPVLESPGLRRLRLRSVAKERIRSLLGPRAVRALQRLRGR